MISTRILTLLLLVVTVTSCGVDVLPDRQVTGVIESTKDLGGGACPLLLASSDGSRWEVALPPTYFMSLDPNDRLVLSSDNGPIARSGERIRVIVSDVVPPQSPCQWGTPVSATEIVRAP